MLFVPEEDDIIALIENFPKYIFIEKLYQRYEIVHNKRLGWKHDLLCVAIWNSKYDGNNNRQEF